MKIISLFLLILLLTVGCTDPDDLLDRDETGELRIDDVYSNIIYADEVLNDLYRRIPNILGDRINNQGRFSGDVYLQGGTVYGQPMINWSNIWSFNSGNWNSSNLIFNSESWPGNEWMNVYDRNYQSIRAALLFLENFEDVPFNSEFGFGPEEQQQKLAEAKFLLAFYHHELMKFFGGVRIVEDALIPGEDFEAGARHTYDENVAYVVDLLDQAAEILPESWPGSEWGRATKGAALALKARVLLHAASPLFNNPETPDDSPFYGSYDPQKWERAASAAYDVIALNRYELHPNIAEIFHMHFNMEIIFSRMQPPAAWPTVQAFPPGLGVTTGNEGRNQGTYNLISQYKVIHNGEAYNQSDPESGWDMQDPYQNLDPRFYRDWAYNTARIRGYDVELYRLGNNTSNADRAANNTTNTNSYHVLIKFGNHGSPGNYTQNSPANFPHLRYAEVLLNYAEAMNEAFGPELDGLSNGLTARDAVNEIRRRTVYPDRQEYMGLTGGMPDFPGGLSRDEFRKELHQERRIELNYEEHVFFDLRRWMEPVESQTVTKWLVPYLHRDDDNNTYFEYVLETHERAFEERWRLKPLHDSQLQLNPELVQNPGW